jgi:pimeloyl-ACP methyl ester carboxylesterase
MPKARINDLDLYYEVDGEGDTAIIFAHGGGATHVEWWRQVYALRDRYRCVTFDARGCGQTTLAAGAPADALVPTRINAMAGRDLLGLMDHLGIAKAFLNGHSAGGHAVSSAAQSAPDRVLGLVMTNTAFGFQTATLSKWAGEMMEKFPRGFAVYDHIFAPTFAARDPETAYFHRELLRLNETRRPKDTWDYAKHYEAAYRQMRDSRPVDYSRFPVPTLFVAGEQDELTVPWLIHGTAAAVGGARLVQIPGVGHCPYCESPGLYNAVLMSFLDHLAPARR